MQTIFEPDALERKENQLQLFFTRIVLFAKYIFHIKKKHLKKVEMIMLIITTGCRVSASQSSDFPPETVHMSAGLHSRLSTSSSCNSGPQTSSLLSDVGSPGSSLMFG